MPRRTESYKLSRFDMSLHNQGYELIAGADEAGRGPLAGPVVAAAVIFPADINITGIDDSKALSAAQREKAFKKIMEASVAVGLGVVDAEAIDRINILQASLQAMSYAVCSLKVKPDLILLDGNKIPENLHPKLKTISARAVVGGDSKSLTIAAASIIAKCIRDSLMRTYHDSFPEYGFDKHKGYGTAGHLKALAQYGPCRIHRKSFEPIKSILGARQ